MQIKERKEMDDLFKKAQKPWAKLLTKVEKAKIDYHSACKTEKSAQNQERNANSDSSLSPDQLKKMQDRVQKTKDEVQKGREKYEQSLSEINKYNSTYIEVRPLRTTVDVVTLQLPLISVGHDECVPEVPGDGRDSTTILQGRLVLHPQSP